METKPRIFFVDIDNTICATEGTDYKHAQPIVPRINVINRMYDRGHAIVYYTGRGVAQAIDYSELTRKQLDEWECRYTGLRFDKPIWDYLIDDRAVPPTALTDSRKVPNIIKGKFLW